MSSHRLVMAGLIAGFVTIVVVAIVLAAVGPDVAPPSGTSGSPPVPTASSGPSGPAASGAPSGAPGSAGTSASGGAAPGSPAPTSSSAGSGDLGAAFHVGSPAPALDLPQLGGGRLDLARLRGKAVWIEFTATWCPSCRDDAAAMTSFSERYHDQGLVAIAVDVREDEATVTSFASSIDGTYPIGLDTDGTAERAWSVAALPTHFFVDASGVIRAGAVGTIGRDVLARSLGLIMPGTIVTP
jgi:thiol-disulfide isomerase/thioredoxin